MDFLLGTMYELIGVGHDRIKIVKYLATAADGSVACQVCHYNEGTRNFEAASDARVRRGLRRKSVRPMLPAGISTLSVGDIQKNQLVEAKRPFGYAVCSVVEILEDGRVLVRDREENVQTHHPRDLRRHMKFRRHTKEWIDHSFISLDNVASP